VGVECAVDTGKRCRRIYSRDDARARAREREANKLAFSLTTVFGQPESA